MKTIKDQYFDGERPLYESRDLRIERVRIGEGESGLKVGHRRKRRKSSDNVERLAFSV